MSEQPILGSLYKAFNGLVEGFDVSYDPPTSAQIEPGVLRMRNNLHTASFGSAPSTVGWVGGSGIGQGTTLRTASDNLTRINDVIHFAGKLYHWSTRNIWEYDPQSEAGLTPVNSTWDIKSTPTNAVGPHLGLYGVTVSGQARMATVALEGTTSARMIVYNPITDTWDSGNTGTVDITSLTDGVYAETTFNNRIYFVGSEDTVSVFDTQRLEITNIDLPGVVNRPMDFQPFQGRMYLMTNTSNSGTVIWDIDLVTGASVATNLPGTDGSGGFPGAYSDPYTRNVLFQTTNPAHATGGTRWPSGKPGLGVPSPHMVAMVAMNATSGAGVPGYGTYAIINNGDKFNHSMEAVPARFSIHPFSNGSFRNGPFQQGQGNVARAFVDDTSSLGAGVPGGFEFIYIQFRTWTLTADGFNGYFPHSKDGSFRHNYDYRGPNTDMEPYDGAVQSGGGFTATAATSFPQHYAGGHRYHGPGFMDIYVTDIEQGVQAGLENDNMRVKFRIVNNEDVPNGTPVFVRLMYAEHNGGPTKGTGILENPSVGTVFDSTRLDIPAVDSGTIYSVEWNNKAQGFIDTEETQFTMYVINSGV